MGVDEGVTAGGQVQTHGSGQQSLGWRVVPLLVPLSGAVVVVLASVLGMDFGEPTRPGPAVWPVIVAVALVIASVITLLIDRAPDHDPFTRRSWLVLAGVGALAVFIWLFAVVGLLIAGAIMLFIWLRFLGGERWWVAASLAVVIPVATYLLFAVALGSLLTPDVIAQLFGGR